MDIGGGAFYGPKIDIKIRDAIGRKWQCSTVQASLKWQSVGLPGVLRADTMACRMVVVTSLHASCAKDIWMSV